MARGPVDVNIALIVTRIVDFRDLDGGSVETLVEENDGKGAGLKEMRVCAHTDIVLPSLVHSRFIPIRKISHRVRIRPFAASSYVNVDSVTANDVQSQAILMYVDA